MLSREAAERRSSTPTVLVVAVSLLTQLAVFAFCHWQHGDGWRLLFLRSPADLDTSFLGTVFTVLTNDLLARTLGTCLAALLLDAESPAAVHVDWSGAGRSSVPERGLRHVAATLRHFNFAGNALRQFGDLAGALDSYGQAVVLRPDYAEVYTNLGNVAIELGDLDQAVSHHRRAAELKPDLAQAYHNLGGTYRTARDYEKAAEALSEARKRDPDNFDTLMALGAVFKELGRLAESLECLRRAYSLRPGDPGCTTLMVLIVRQIGGANADVKHIADAVVETPRRADAFAALASSLETMNILEDAGAAAQEALALDGDHLLANVVAARLERRYGRARTF